MIAWFNENQGFLTVILSVVAVFSSLVALILSVWIAKRQERIALFDKRFSVYHGLQEYTGMLGNWVEYTAEEVQNDDDLQSYVHFMLQEYFQKNPAAEVRVKLKNLTEEGEALFRDFDGEKIRTYAECLTSNFSNYLKGNQPNYDKLWDVIEKIQTAEEALKPLQSQIRNQIRK